jgi:hypothetical protein
MLTKMKTLKFQSKHYALGRFFHVFFQTFFKKSKLDILKMSKIKNLKKVSEKTLTFL